MKKYFVIPLIVSILFGSQQSFADQKGWKSVYENIKNHLSGEQGFPFKTKMNLSKAHRITQVHPKMLVSEIEKNGVKVLLVKDSDIKNIKNSNFKDLKYATQEILDKSQFKPSYLGRMIPKSYNCCGFNQDLILIKDTADNYTLIHEYLHTLIKLEGSQPSEKIESDYSSIERKQIFYQKKILLNQEFLLSPLWRRDILRYQNEIANLMFDRFRIGQVQEAIIEKTLAKYIDNKNPNYTLDRHQDGLKYAELSIENMISVYNNIHFSITWNKNTVLAMQDSLSKGDLLLAEKNESLTKEEAEVFANTSNEQLRKLKVVENEILKIKEFITK